MKNINKIIGHKIRVLRTNKRLNQHAMAKHLKLSIAAYSNLETGKIEITVSKIYQISEMLGVKPIEIMNIENNTFEIV
jgi:transcriptional regulator with XRE-family HTH domain